MATRNPSQKKKNRSKRSAAKRVAKDQPQSSAVPETPPQRRTPGYIPEAVSQRMVRRVALFCGIPTALGLGSFILNYFLITQDVVELPTYFTLIETLVLFGLGFVGITYGVLSASWEPYPGSALGWSEFRTNLGNMIQQWREYAAQKRNPSSSDPDTTERDD